MSCYKAVVFDFDGTLFDTELHERKTLAALVEQATGEYPSEEKLSSTFGMTGPQAMQYLGCDAEQMEWVWPRWYDASVKALQTTPMFDGIKETILKLNTLKIRLGIVTSRNIGGVRVGLCAHQILQAFAEIVCQEDTVQHKPAPDPLLECAKRLEVEPAQVLYIGDSAVDMQCAKSAGAHSGLALWGTHEPELECDYRFARPEDILAIFKE
ncbi:MAG: HAD family hydrolase [Butyricicoccus pullicaecorum]|nr:HAD family hydrolase [Butyricicoccus pullicaecorum]